jgi:hypothetical protein
MDEWSINNYNPYRGEDSRREIDIAPTESYIDFALYWYAKPFAIANNKGVYWDHYFFVPSYNTMMTAAYKRKDGSIMPSLDFWGLRELAKRTFQYMNDLESGKQLRVRDNRVKFPLKKHDLREFHLVPD